jgi:ubiquinone/menaquinone biosynthesis C-methylase UbiE
MSAAGEPVAFDYSEEFRALILRQLKDREGRPEHERWYRMAMTRVDFQRRHFLPALMRYTDCAERDVLEVGCGTGPSTVVMAERGARVIALDVSPSMVEAARLRVRDHGFADRAEVRLVEHTRTLDFPDARFDLVVCNGVLEHVEPAEREPIMREMWRVLRPHGHLFIGETPNRLWPIDDHTTGLWWTHYMPRNLARRYAAWRGKIKPADDLNAMGGFGCRFNELVRCVPRNEVRVLNHKPPYSWIARRRQELSGRPLRRAFVGLLAAVQYLLLEPLAGLPIDGLLPYLTMAMEKLG